MKQILEMPKKGEANTGTFIVIFIVLLVGSIFLAPIQDALAVASANSTAVVQTLVDLIPLFYVLLLMAVVAVPVIRAFNKAGR